MIDDLTPFFSDPCWMFVLLAREANVGVILRRGPTKWWHVTLWDTKADRFQSGQWFRGHLYPDRCDLSPDGSLLSYFAGKFRLRDISSTWIAVSRPPYLTALALWPIGDTWGGKSVFTSHHDLLIVAMTPHDPEHPPGPLRVTRYPKLEETDPLRKAQPCWNVGWEGAREEPSSRSFRPRYAAWRKPNGKLVLERDAKVRDPHGRLKSYQHTFPSRAGSFYTLYRGSDAVAKFEAHWADWDQQGRLVATVGGRIVAGSLDRRNNLHWKQLASFATETPEPLVAPQWAQNW